MEELSSCIFNILRRELPDLIFDDVVREIAQKICECIGEERNVFEVLNDKSGLIVDLNDVVGIEYGESQDRSIGGVVVFHLRDSQSSRIGIKCRSVEEAIGVAKHARSRM